MAADESVRYIIELVNNAKANEAEGRKAAESAQRGADAHMASTGGGGGGGGGGKPFGPQPQFEPDDRRRQRVSEQLGINITTFKALEKATRDLAAAVRVVNQATNLRNAKSLAEQVMPGVEAREVYWGGYRGRVMGREAAGIKGTPESAGDLAQFTSAIREFSRVINAKAALATFGPTGLPDAGESMTFASNRLREQRRRSVQSVLREAAGTYGPVTEDVARLQGQFPDVDRRVRAAEAKRRRTEDTADVDAREGNELNKILEAAKRRLANAQKQKRSYEDLAAAEAQTPGTLRPHELAELNRTDPNLLPGAQTEAASAAKDREYAERRGRLKTYIHSDASFGDKFVAGLSGRAPGEPHPQGGFGAGFLEGFFGDEGRLDRALGQAARFSVLYGGLYAIQGAVTAGFSAAAKSAAEYEQALIQLNLATSRTTSENKALADAAAASGVSLGIGPTESVQAAARAQGLLGLNEPGVTENQRKDLTQLSTQVSGRVASLSGMDVQDVQTKLAGITRSYNMSPYEMPRLEDYLTTVSKRAGGTPGDLLSAAAQVAPIAQVAGYDPAELFAILGTTATQTGRTKDAVAGDLSQVLSKAYDPAAEKRLADVGVNTLGTTFKEQIKQLHDLHLSPGVEAQVVQGFGRSRSGASFDVLVKNLERSDALAQEAKNTPAGAGERAFEQYMNTLVGTLRRIGAGLQDIANSLAQAGLLQAVEHVIGLFGLLVDITDQLVHAYTGLPEPLKDAIAYLLEFALLVKGANIAMRVLAARRSAGGFAAAAAESLPGALGLGSVGGPSGASLGPLGAEQAAAATARAARLATVGAQRAATAGEMAALRATGAGRLAIGGAALRGGLGIASTGLNTGFRLLTSALLGLPGMLLAAGGTIVAGWNNAAEAENATRASYMGALASSAAATTPAEMQGSAAQLDQAVKNAQEQRRISLMSIISSGGANLFNYFDSNSLASFVERTAPQRAKDMRDEANTTAAETLKANAADPTNQFLNFQSTDNVQQALDELGKQGYSAAERLTALNQAIAYLNTVSTAAASNTAGVATGIGGIIPKGGRELFALRAGQAAGATKDALVGAANKRAGDLNPTRNLSGWDEYWSGLVHGDQGQWASVGPWWRKMLGVGGNYRTKGEVEAQPYEELIRRIGGGNKQLDTNATAAVNKVLADAGVDTTKGPVVISPETAGKVQAAVRGVAEKQIGKLPDDLAKQFTDLFGASYAAQTGQYLGGKVTPEMVGAISEIGVQAAAAATQDAGVLNLGDQMATATGNRRYLETQRAQAMSLANQLSDPAARAANIRKINNDYAVPLATAYQQQAAAAQGELSNNVAVSQSRYSIDDTGGRRKAELDAVNADLANTITPAGVAELKKDLGHNLSDAARANIQHTLDTAVVVNAKDYAAKVAARDELTQNNAQADRQAQRANALARIDPANNRARLLEQQRQYAADVQRTKGLSDTSQAKADAVSGLAGVNQQIGDYDAQQQLAKAQLGVAPNDAVGLARVAYVAAQHATKRAQSQGDPLAIVQAQLAERQARIDSLSANQDNADKQRQANIAPDSQTGFQKANLDSARQRLALSKQGVGDQLQAQIDYNKAVYDYSQATLKYQAAIATDYDWTNPLEAGKQALGDIQKQIDAAQSPEAKTMYEADKKKQQWANQKTESDLILTNIGDMEQLGDLSHEAAQRARRAQLGAIQQQLAGMKEGQAGYYQLQQEAIEYRKAIRAADDQLQGQFNIGEIKLPTVYEIRRSLTGVGGDMAGTTATAGNTYNTTINGADFARVVDYISAVLGAAPTRATTPRKVASI